MKLGKGIEDIDMPQYVNICQNDSHSNDFAVSVGGIICIDAIQLRLEAYRKEQTLLIWK